MKDVAGSEAHASGTCGVEQFVRVELSGEVQPGEVAAVRVGDRGATRKRPAHCFDKRGSARAEFASERRELCVRSTGGVQLGDDHRRHVGDASAAPEESSVLNPLCEGRRPREPSDAQPGSQELRDRSDSRDAVLLVEAPERLRGRGLEGELAVDVVFDDQQLLLGSDRDQGLAALERQARAAGIRVRRHEIRECRALTLAAQPGEQVGHRVRDDPVLIGRQCGGAQSAIAEDRQRQVVSRGFDECDGPVSGAGTGNQVECVRGASRHDDAVELGASALLLLPALDQPLAQPHRPSLNAVGQRQVAVLGKHSGCRVGDQAGRQQVGVRLAPAEVDDLGRGGQLDVA